MTISWAASSARPCPDGEVARARRATTEKAPGADESGRMGMAGPEARRIWGRRDGRLLSRRPLNRKLPWGALPGNAIAVGCHRNGAQTGRSGRPEVSGEPPDGPLPFEQEEGGGRRSAPPAPCFQR